MEKITHSFSRHPDYKNNLCGHNKVIKTDLADPCSIGPLKLMKGTNALPPLRKGLR